MNKKSVLFFCTLLSVILTIMSACSNAEPSEGKEMFSSSVDSQIVAEDNSAIEAPENEQNQAYEYPIKNGFITGQILNVADGGIHYSYYLPEGYDESKDYPMMLVMPGYDRM